jgi:glutamate transport system substrate-binding protein
VHGDGGPPSVTDRDTLVIGVRDTPPGLAHRAGDGSLEGFYIDVSTYIAGRLGVTSSHLTFRALASDEWETALSRGTVDMVVAAYTITHDRQERVTLAGPYYGRASGHPRLAGGRVRPERRGSARQEALPGLRV